MRCGKPPDAATVLPTAIWWRGGKLGAGYPRLTGELTLRRFSSFRLHMRRLDEQYDRARSTALIPKAGQYLGQITFLGTHARRSYVRRELRGAEAEAATLMGQLVWDAWQRRDHGTAVAYFDQAVQASQEHADKAAEGLALLRKSFVALYGWHDPKAGLTLTERTTDTAACASHVLGGLEMLHMAESHAMLGNGRDCETALERARDEFARIEPSDPAIDLFSPSQTGRLTGFLLPVPPGCQEGGGHSRRDLPGTTGPVEIAGCSARQPCTRLHPSGSARRGRGQAELGDRCHRAEPRWGRHEHHLHRWPPATPMAGQHAGTGRP